MNDYLSEVRYETIDAMTVISGIAFGNNPEETIMSKMAKFAHDHNQRVKRSFGFDFPVEGTQDIQQYRGYEYWLMLSENPTENLIRDTDYTIKNIPSLTYVTLRITDPFSAAFERIPNGWKTLVGWLEINQVKTNSGPNHYCLEEVKEIDGIMYMDLYVPVEAE